MNVQHSLILALVIYKFKLGQNTAEAIKNICSEKGEGTVDHSLVTK